MVGQPERYMQKELMNPEDERIQLQTKSNIIKENSMEGELFRFADNTALCLSPDFILPEEKRPSFPCAPLVDPIPIIDLKLKDGVNGSHLLVQNISKACEDLGMFQVINHGVPQALCQAVMAALLQFFQLPSEERANFLTEDHSEQVKIFNYYCKVGNQKIKMWSETFSHPWHPTQAFTHLLPKYPPQYREVFAEYGREIGALMNKLFGLMSQGLGLEKDCIVQRVGDRPNLYSQANYYPPCPEPELTLGLNEHNDITALTVLQQTDGVTGLQVNKDGNWVTVEPVPGALVIILPDQMQVLTNGRYKSAVHRAVTNKWLPRVSLAMFYAPNDATVIGPIENLINEEHPPKYRSYMYKEYMEEFYRQLGKRRRVKEAFEL